MSKKSINTSNDTSEDLANEKRTDTEGNSTDESSPSWIPSLATSWVNTAKEKTISTFEMMKKDIHEFSDTLQQGANTLAGVTVKQAHHLQSLIAPVPDNVDEEQNKTEIEGTSKQIEEETTNKASKDKSGLFSLGWVKQVVDTVHKYATEDTVEDECTEELFIRTSGRKTILDQFTLLQMQNDVRTFTQPPQQNVDLYKEWLNDFKISEYNGEINLLLSNNPRLREIYAELVPSQVDNNAFWNRYFFKVHLKELDKQISMAEAPSFNLNIDQTTKETHSPGTSNGKDDWSMCSSGPAAEELEEENEREKETSTPRPGQKPDDEVDDWEECVDDANANKNEVSIKNKE